MQAGSYLMKVCYYSIKIMKLSITILLIFFTATSIAQSPFRRSASVVTAVDSHLRTDKSLGLAIYTDTANYSGLDSLGTLIYVKSQGEYLRDTIPGGHKWSLRGAASYTFNTSDFTVTGTAVALKYSTMQVASGSQPGILSVALFNTFNGKLSNITGLITAGSNITITGSGTSGSPYIIASSGGGSGITSLNGLSGATQTFAVGTSGTDFAVSSSGTVHTFNLPVVTASNTGKVTPTLFNTWNGKADPATGAITTVYSSNLSASKAVISDGSGKLSTSATTSTELGYLSGVTNNLQFLVLQYTTQTLTDAATITMNCNSGFIGEVTLGGNRTLAFSNFPAKGTIQIKVIQDATGSRTLTLPASSKVPIGFGSGTTINLTTTGLAYDLLFCSKDSGGNYNWTIAKQFQ